MTASGETASPSGPAPEAHEREESASWAESPAWLVPNPSPEDTEFWSGARRGELRIQHCRHCGLHQHYARIVCSHCGSTDLEWVTASGRGVVHSFTVIRQNGVPPFNERVPFVVALVELEEAGARILAAMPECEPAGARIGMPVEAAFRAANDDLGFVDFRPVPNG